MRVIKLFSALFLVVITVAGIVMIYSVWSSSVNLNGFECKAVISSSEVNGKKSYKSLKLSMLFKDSQHGLFNIYGFIDASAHETYKVTRIINFNYTLNGHRIDTTQISTDKYNNDTAPDESLPEFLTSKSAVFRIDKLNDVDYIIYDDVSPAFICRVHE
ncbi:hypothetical protein [Budvicia aquatica]|uniref:Uncharacterized protein n=1 Tax=Budvicia aquatica TaxID=82979 RepID=A0A2C6DIE7_9GAMM|nr:hypothetical protein [Budvicia aquatica]PHI28533.1 hypothetical protein CRN84_03895 [Budvicia aquatica]